jgi:hypothetical protein
MNERIRQFAEQSGWLANERDVGDQYRFFNQLKFAKLVAKECASIAEEGRAVAVDVAIKKYFGIE